MDYYNKHSVHELRTPALGIVQRGTVIFSFRGDSHTLPCKIFGAKLYPRLQYVAL